MAKRIGVVLIGLLLIITGCSNSAKLEWQTREDFAFISYDYPQDWVVREGGLDLFLAFISREEYSPVKHLNDSVIMITGQRADEEQSVRDFIEEHFVGEEGRIVSESDEMIDGYHAKKIISEYQEETDDGVRTIHTIAYDVNTQSQAGLLISMQYIDEFKDDVEIFDEFMKRIKFDPKN